MKKFCFKGIIPILNLAQKGTLRNVYAITHYTDEKEGIFEGILTIKEDALKSNNRHAFIKGQVKDGKVSFMLLSNRELTADESMDIYAGKNFKDLPSHFIDIELSDTPRTVGSNLSTGERIGGQLVSTIHDTTAINNVHGASLTETDIKNISQIFQPLLLADYKEEGKQTQAVDEIKGDFFLKHFDAVYFSSLKKLIKEMSPENLKILDEYEKTLQSQTENAESEEKAPELQ